MTDTASSRHITKKTLKARGWTDSAIRRFLGAPDKQRRNPYGGSAPPILLWRESRVLEAEASPYFQVWQEVTAKRRQQASARMLELHDAWRKESIEWAESIPISVVALSPQKALQLAINHYNTHQFECGRDDYEPATINSRLSFLRRITVNYLRHCGTDYERLLTERFGKTGVNEAIRVIRRRVYEKIAETYPDLAYECQRQWEDRERQMQEQQKGLTG